MSEEKPKSIYGEGGRVTESITWSEEGYRIVEKIDISTNGATGLTKEIEVFLPGAPFTPINPLDPGNEDILKIIQNSSKREQLYHTKMNEIRVDALENGTSDDFEQSLKDNGTYEAIAGAGSINDIEIKGENKRNNEKIKKKLADERAELQKYLDSIQVKKENLFYPSNLEQNKGEDYIFIEQFEYSPPQPPDTVNPEKALKSGVPRTTNLEDSRGTCRLPIPNKLGVSNGVSWGEARANAVELGAFAAAAGGIGAAIGGSKNIGQLLQEGFGSGGRILKNLQSDFKSTTGSEANAASVISAALARSVLGSIGINVDVDQFITRQTGAAINPNLELLFGGPQLRTFSFNFNFAPENPEEAVMVRKIQRWFRQGMLPTRSAGTRTNSTLFLGSPNVFRLQYKNKNRRIKGLNIIKVCALTACQIDFTPDGTYQSYDDQDAISMPVRSTMGLTFNELTPIFKDDYTTEDKYKDQSIVDLGSMIKGDDAINEHDIGF